MEISWQLYSSGAQAVQCPSEHVTSIHSWSPLLCLPLHTPSLHLHSSPLPQSSLPVFPSPSSPSSSFLPAPSILASHISPRLYFAGIASIIRALLSSSLADLMGTNENQNNETESAAAGAGRRPSKAPLRTQKSLQRQDTLPKNRLQRQDTHPKSL